VARLQAPGGEDGDALETFLKIAVHHNNADQELSYELGRGCVLCCMQTLRCLSHLDGDWHKQNKLCILIFLAQQAIQKHWALLSPDAGEEWRKRAVALLCSLRDELREGSRLLHVNNWTSTLHDEVVAPALSPPPQAAPPARINFQ
jgi:hypothetical protein